MHSGSPNPEARGTQGSNDTKMVTTGSFDHRGYHRDILRVREFAPLPSVMPLRHQ